MLVVGVILLIVGAVSVLYGVAQVAGLVTQAFIPSPVAFVDPYLFWVIAGAIVAIVGIILVVARKKNTAKS